MPLLARPTPIAFLALASYLLTAAMGLGQVLCFGPDGHIQVESRTQACSVPAPSSPGGETVANIASVAGTSSSSCHDVPLQASHLASPGARGDAVKASLYQVAGPCPQTLPLQTGTLWGSLMPLMRAPHVPCSPLAALSTVVLLV